MNATKGTSALQVGEDVSRDLLDVRDRYVGGCPFQSGELVTPRRGVNYLNAGVPHIVLEVDPDPAPFRPQSDARDVGCASWGSRADMRVAHRGTGDDDHIVTHWVESWAFRRMELSEMPPSVREEVRRRGS